MKNPGLGSTRALVLFLCLTSAASGQDSPARPDDSGLLSTEALGVIQKSIAVGWTKEQVSFLAGRPEHVENFSSSLEVWRYRTDAELLLVAFTDGNVAEVSRRPIPPKAIRATIERALNEAASEPPPPSPSKHALSPYDEIGTVFGIKLGLNEPHVREELEKRGLRFGSDPKDARSVTCRTERGQHFCVILPPAAPDWNLDPPGGPTQILSLGFDRTGKLVSIVQMILSDDAGAVQTSYSRNAATLGALFKAPSKHALGEYGRVSAWALRTVIGGLGKGKLTSSEGWASDGTSADMLLYESTASPRHQLFIIHGLPEYF